MPRDQPLPRLPRRWIPEPMRGSAAERKAALLFRRALRAPHARPDLSAVNRRLRVSWAAAGGEAARPRRRRLLLAVAATLAIAALSVAATAGVWRWRLASGRESSAPAERAP